MLKRRLLSTGIAMVRFSDRCSPSNPYYLHLHMISLALVRQEYELARSARNADTFNSRSLKHPLPDTTQGIRPVRNC